MATIMASRCTMDKEMHDVKELYTYGSPRVGWSKYCKSISITHYRWRNNNDIVTVSPPLLIGYRHHGIPMYINAYGQVKELTGWQLLKDKLRGTWMGIKTGRFDSFADHNITNYINSLENWDALNKNHDYHDY